VSRPKVLESIKNLEAQQTAWNNKVDSVNGKTGTVITLTAADVGAVATADKNTIVDDTTNKVYKLGITNGALYYKEVSE
jgi:flagellar basal body P-ring protein FlgI